MIQPEEDLYWHSKRVCSGFSTFNIFINDLQALRELTFNGHLICQPHMGFLNNKYISMLGTLKFLCNLILTIIL